MNITKEMNQISGTIDSIHLICSNTLTPLEKMILVLEDRRFFSHPGFDLFSIVRAIIVTLLRGKGGGASTIEQQLVRTITGYHERTITRKIKEIRLAYRVSQQYSKIRILRAYEKLAYFGENVQGVEDAAQRLFGKSTQYLNISEAATVASCLVNPIPSKPKAHWEERIQRRSAYALNVSQYLVIGKSCFGYRAGFRRSRPHLISEHLACALENLCTPST